METLARWAAWLAIAGGAVMAAMLFLVVATDPAASPAWNLMWGAVALLGAAVLGLYGRTRSAVGRLGGSAAWVSALGAAGLLVVAAYAIATDQLDAGQDGPDPLWPLWIGTFGAWLGGNVVFALALLRARSLSSLGALLVVAGTAIGLAGSLLGGENPPAALLLLFVPFGVGWIVMGDAANRRAEPSAGDVLQARISQFVRAPIERVYGAYVDPALMPKWMGIKAITDMSGPLDRPGTTFVEVVYGPYRPRSEVLAAEPPVLHDMGGRSIRGIAWRWTARFAVQGEGTEITLAEEVRFPAGLVSGLLRRSQEGGRMERGLGRRLAHFAALVEAGET